MHDPRIESPSSVEDRDLLLAREVLRRSAAAAQAFALRLRCVPRIVGELAARHGYVAEQPDTADEDLGGLEDEDPDVLADPQLALAVEVAIDGIWRRLPEYHGRVALETWFYESCYLAVSEELVALDEAPLFEALSSIGAGGDVLRLLHVEERSRERTAEVLGLRDEQLDAAEERALARVNAVLGGHGPDDDPSDLRFPPTRGFRS